MKWFQQQIERSCYYNFKGKSKQAMKDFRQKIAEEKAYEGYKEAEGEKKGELLNASRNSE